MKRERFIPKGALKIAAKDSDAVAYLYDVKGKPNAIFYRGKSVKPAWHFRFNSVERRAAKLVENFRGEAAAAVRKAAERAEKAAWVNPYKAGDVFRSSWGYDQTNVDHYQCVAVRGSMLVVREIAAESGGGDMSGYCVPVPDKFIGDERRFRAQPQGFKVASYAWASFVEPIGMIGDKPVYPSAYWSSYA